MYKLIKRVSLFIFLFAFSLTGCKKSVEKPPTDITILTADSTGSLYHIGCDFAEILNNNLSYINASALTSQGGIYNLNNLKSNTVVTFAVTSIAYESYNGTGYFTDNSNEKLRVLAGLYYNPNQIIVKQDINCLEDLVGKTFSPGVLGSTTINEASTHFQTLDINMEESINIVNSSYSDSVLLMQKNQLDGAWIMAGVPNKAITTITQNNDGKLIGLSNSTLAMLQSNYPWYAKFIIPAGTYDNQTEDVQTSAVKLVLLTSSELDDDIAYDIVKSFWEHIDSLKETNPALRSISLQDTTSDLADLPLHNGAARYYKEKGIMK